MGTPRTSANVPYFTPMNFPHEAAYFARGFTVDAPPQAWTCVDIGVLNKLVGPLGVCYFAGGIYECFTAAEKGSEFEISVVDRDDILGYFVYYGMSRSRLDNLTGVSGTFQVGEIVEGAASGCQARVLSVSPTKLEVTFARWDKTTTKLSTFTDGEGITGLTSGATATLDTPAFTEGDFIEVAELIEDETLRGLRVGEFRPGGAEPLIEGLYVRICVWNNAAGGGADLEMAVLFEVGRM